MRIERVPQIPLPPLKELVVQTEALASWGRPAGAGQRLLVRGVALNTARLDEKDARLAVERIQDELELPCTDPVRWGGESLLEAVTRGD